MPSRGAAGKRFLATVLFTDIVGSTDIATELGDRRWRELLGRHHALIRRELKRHGGREIDTAGDGFFATFDAPADGIRCASAASEGVHDLGIDIRAGIHVGECEVMGKKVGGIAVHTAARVLSAAGSADILATSTAKDLVAGGGIGFEDRGTHRLKGIQGEWQLYAVTSVDGERRPPPLEAVEAAAVREGIAPAPVLRRRRTPIAVAAVIVVALAVAAVAFFARRAPGGITPQPDSVSEIRAGDTAFTRTFTVGSDPVGVATDSGHVWVINQGSGTIQQIDPDSSAPVGQPATTFGPATGIAGGDEAAWVTSGDVTTQASGNPQSRVYRFDSGAEKLESVADVPSGVRAIAVGDGSLWVADPNTDHVLRIEPQTGHTETIDVGHEPVAIAVGPGADAPVWVANALGGSVSKIDPKTDKASEFPVGAAPSGIAVAADGDVWVTSSDANSITRLDATGHKKATIDIPGGPIAVASSGGDVWVAASLAHVLVRIDAGTDVVVETIPVAGTLTALAVDQAGGVWATVRAG